MPSIINVGVVNINTPQQNSSVFFGESVVTGMDANMKFNGGHSGQFGFFHLTINQVNINIDSFEVADGNMLEQAAKNNAGGGNI